VSALMTEPVSIEVLGLRAGDHVRFKFGVTSQGVV